MATELLSVKTMAVEAGICRQALNKHLDSGTITADFETNNRKLFLPESRDRIKRQLVLNRLRHHKNISYD